MNFWQSLQFVGSCRKADGKKKLQGIFLPLPINSKSKAVSGCAKAMYQMKTKLK
jgi:hypothetical protein